MKTIWRRSAKGTPRMERAVVQSGLQPTDPLSVTTYDDELNELMQLRGAHKVGRLYSMIPHRIVHVFGLHFWIPLEEWDVERGSFQEIGLACLFCDIMAFR